MLLPGAYSCGDDTYCGDRQGLTEVPRGIPHHVRTVFLYRNEITSIPSGIFSNLTKCKNLNLENNNITELRPGMFNGLVSLTKLKLSHNHITTIEAGTFDPLEKLTVLWFDRNRITGVDAEMWLGLVSLEKIFLAYNDISFIRTDSFVNLENQNKGQDYPLQNLETLNLNFNEISGLEPGAISGLRKLTRLYLAENKLTEISGEIWNGSEIIRDLWLWGNKLTVVKKNTFLGFANSYKISLEGNDIINIEAGAFAGTTTRFLVLDLNDMSDLRGDMWDGLNLLEKLGLDFNEITEIRADMWGEGFTNLELLSLSHNKIARIEPDAFKRLQSLRFLELDGNLLAEIGPAVWTGAYRLVYLHLGQNQIRYLSDNSIPKLASKSTLNLQNNNLTTLSLSIFDPDDYKSTGGHPQSLYLYLGSNPMHCDISMCWIQEANQEGWIVNSWAMPDCDNHPDKDFLEIDLECEDDRRKRRE